MLPEWRVTERRTVGRNIAAQGILPKVLSRMGIRTAQMGSANWSYPRCDMLTNQRRLSFSEDSPNGVRLDAVLG